MSGADQIVLGSVTIGPAPSSAEDSMAESIVMLLTKLAEVEAERDFYKAAAERLRKKRPAKMADGRGGPARVHYAAPANTLSRRRKK